MSLWIHTGLCEHTKKKLVWKALLVIEFTKIFFYFYKPKTIFEYSGLTLDNWTELNPHSCGMVNIITHRLAEGGIKSSSLVYKMEMWYTLKNRVTHYCVVQNLNTLYGCCTEETFLPDFLLILKRETISSELLYSGDLHLNCATIE